MQFGEDQKKENLSSTETHVGSFTMFASFSSIFLLPLRIFGIVAALASSYSGALVIKQRHKIISSGSVLEKNEKIDRQLDELKKDNKNLRKSVKKIHAQENRMRAIENGLSAMAKKQGTSLNRLIALTEKNQKILDETRKLMRGKISQFILKTVLQCDDGDFKLNEKEINILCLRLNQIENVTFHEAELRKLIISHDHDIMALMGVVRKYRYVVLIILKNFMNSHCSVQF